MQDPFQACSNPLTRCIAVHRTKPCSMYPVRWRDHKRDALGLLGEIFRPRSRAVPFLAAQCLIGHTARSLATYVGPPRARNATLAVALSGSICPSSTPAPSRCWSSGQARAAPYVCGVDGHRLARRQHRCKAHAGCLTSQAGFAKLSTRSIYRSTPFLPRHATMRSEAFQRPSHCCPRKHCSTHAWASCVWQGPLFDELPSGSRARTSPDPGRCGLS